MILYKYCINCLLKEANLKYSLTIGCGKLKCFLKNKKKQIIIFSLPYNLSQNHAFPFPEQT